MNPIQRLWTLISGYKTYTVAVAMFALGVWFLTTDASATWDDPTGAIEAATRHVTAVVLLTQGAATAALRHAIGKGTAQ